ncbi:hypothetical protein CCAX7_41160 [Capsulimonas corticalis]|uniref:Uncharacterized protein n=1 Tax=Capsulimonas corticalis TaxID=2219043 RepID=A0A402D6E0_9BACT|nr:spherulation-specific family 4 protein [Capsulimonas corticalis]BDI32065.1 hypothetical protein CCAX7_41160 [Capsulimonas corticalis]
MKTKKIALVCSALACLSVGAPKAHADGMIIPAYLPLTDTTDWNIIANDATVLKNGTNALYKDYWVTVNGANGPYTTSADWTTAATRFNPIRANGGKIFGYVHTLTTPTSTTFRSLSSVEADITSWVAGYANIDGIWIDEYYPRYEIDYATGGTSPAFPNGTALAPYDTTYLNANGTYKTNYPQIDPPGGYYTQLTGWIRSTYPKLRIIGNAGGKFYSNQKNYTDLVDVTCSYEDSYANASASSWAALARQNTTTPKKQLVLIHSNTTDLAGAINAAISNGYNYFYTTSGVLSNNAWGSIPSYFDTEVSSIANHS